MQDPKLKNPRLSPRGYMPILTGLRIFVCLDRPLNSSSMAP